MMASRPATPPPPATTSNRLEVEPLPCPRPRIALRGRFPVAYYPAAYTKWKERAEPLLREQLRAVPKFTTPVLLVTHFYVKRPKTSKLFVPKPDIDNYQKSIMDALTQSEAWTDDSLVADAIQRKRWATSSYIEYEIHTIPLEDL
jgi:Holliday junction resolvase RusA-like endonuclease